MSKAIRTLLSAGLLLTVVGLIGLAWTAGRPSEFRGLVRYLFAPAYAVGALCLIASGLWWLVRFTRQRDGSR